MNRILLSFRATYFTILTTLCFLVWLSVNAQAPQFIIPLEAEYGKDFIIVNYVDWGGVKDHMCGTKTYRGHQGTDMVLRSFPQMDSGVYVLAADSGVVTFVHDGEFDRNTAKNVPLGFGNYIAIRHPNKMYSYYAHLRKNSLLVQPGEQVSAGQRIALVGSSGNSTDPHLHFETWYDSLYLVDPFAGPCGNPGSLWIPDFPYDTSYHLWDMGMMNFLPPLDSMRFRVMNRHRFTPQDSVIAFWGLQYGLRKGDKTTIKWINPSGSVWFSYTNHYDRDWWYYYYASFIYFPNPPQWGTWKAMFYYNDSLVGVRSFELEPSTAAKRVRDTRRIRYEMVPGGISIKLSGEIRKNAIQLYDMTGRLIPVHLIPDRDKVIISTDQMTYGWFILRIKTVSGYRTILLPGVN